MNFHCNTLSLVVSFGVVFMAGFISVMIIGVIFADALTTATVDGGFETGFTTAATGAFEGSSAFFTSSMRSTKLSRSRTLLSASGMFVSSSSGNFPRVFESSPSKNDKSISVKKFLN